MTTLAELRAEAKALGIRGRSRMGKAALAEAIAGHVPPAAPSVQLGVMRYVERIGDCTLYLADCRDILPTLPAETAIVSDPPYGIGFQKGPGGRSCIGRYKIRGYHPRNGTSPIIGDDKPFDPAHLLRFGELILWGADHYAQRLPRGRWLAWDKLAGHDPWDSFSDVEYAWHSVPGAARIFSLLWKGALKGSEKTAGRHRERWHPTQKPIALMEWCVGQLKADADRIICDPYMGSGTTGVACTRLGRRFVGIEVDQGYFEVACRRIAEAYKQPDLLRGPGAFAGCEASPPTQMAMALE